MLKVLINKIKSLERDFLIFLLVGVFLGIAQSVDGATFNNFLKEKFNMVILQRSFLELPRELPGFLVFLVTGLLYALGDIRIAAIANLCAAVGMFSLGIIPANYAIMLVCIFTYSMGQHVYMPISNSIGMSFAKDEKLGRKLGQLSAANTAALVVSSAILWVLFKFLKIPFVVSFTIGALAFVIAACLLMLMKRTQMVKIKNRFVFKKEYTLFYWLNIVYGARKQIFLTFAPWVLVDVFKQSVTTMTILFFIISILSIFFRPFLGYLIDSVGEKFVLAGEAVILFFVCLGYTFAENILPGGRAVILAAACYVIDNMLGAVSMARATYLKKIAVQPEDVSPTLAAGTSIDHIISMTIPALGGFVWYSFGAGGYKYVFLGGAVIALINFFSTRLIKINKA